LIVDQGRTTREIPSLQWRLVKYLGRELITPHSICQLAHLKIFLLAGFEYETLEKALAIIVAPITQILAFSRRALSGCVEISDN
jgi:hypothetical protein